MIGTKHELAGFGNETRGLIDSTPTHPIELDEHMAKQHAAARIVALQLIEHVPGPKLLVSMTGHANGIGEVEKPGWSNDYINVKVMQITT
jgi:hypothetical protein